MARSIYTLVTLLGLAGIIAHVVFSVSVAEVTQPIVLIVTMSVVWGISLVLAGCLLVLVTHYDRPPVVREQSTKPLRFLGEEKRKNPEGVPVQGQPFGRRKSDIQAVINAVVAIPGIDMDLANDLNDVSDQNKNRGEAEA